MDPFRRPLTWPLLFTALVLWAGAYLGNAYIVRDYPPPAAALLRGLVASAFFAALALWRRPTPPPRGQRWRPLAAGAAGMAVYNLLLIQGQHQVEPAAASFLVQLSPLFAAVLAHSVLGDRLRLSGWIGLALALCGVACMALPRLDDPALLRHGGLVVLSAATWGSYHIIQKPLIENIGARSATTFAVWAGACLLLPFAPLLFDTLRRAPPSATIVVIALGLGPSALAFLAWGAVLERLPVSRVIGFLYAIPLLVILGQTLLATGHCDRWTWLGGGIIVVGVAATQWPRRTARP